MEKQIPMLNINQRYFYYNLSSAVRNTLKAQDYIVYLTIKHIGELEIEYIILDGKAYFEASTKTIQGMLPLFNYSLKTIKRSIVNLCDAKLIQRSNQNEILGKLLVRLNNVD